MRKLIGIIFTIIFAFNGIAWSDSFGDSDEKKPQGVTVSEQKAQIAPYIFVLPKDPILAGLLSGGLPGAGQFYCRKWLKGGFFLLSTVALYGTANEYAKKADDQELTQEERDEAGVVAGLLSLSGLIMHVWNIYDAYKTAEVYNHRALEKQTGLGKWKIGIDCQFNKTSLFLAANF